MHISSRPTKNTLILIHGALMDNRIWLDRLQLFPQADTIIMPDLAGHGSWQASTMSAVISDNSPPLTPDYLARHMMQHSLDPMKDKIESSQIHIAGHSLGGLVALHLQKHLRAQGKPVRSILLGDSPIYPYGETPSQKAAIEQLKQTPLGRNLLAHCFHHFNAEDRNIKPRKNYEAILREVAESTEITIAMGLQGVHQRKDGAWDCGTFLSPGNRTRLQQITEERLRLAEIRDAGHFVFHSEIGSELLKRWF